MGKFKEEPRYNIISTRVSDPVHERLISHVGKNNVALFVNDAIIEKLERECHGKTEKTR